MRKPRLVFVAVVGVVLACLVGGMLLVEVVPKESKLTKTAPGLRARILRYSLETGHAPESLVALAVADPPSAQFVTDPWGQDFLYAASPDGVITLTSLSGYTTIGDAAKHDAIRVWRFRLKSSGGSSMTGDADEGWIGNDRWGKPKTIITQSK